MSGQRSADSDGTHLAAGCALNEAPRPAREPAAAHHHHHHDVIMSSSDENLLMLFAWGRGEDGQLGAFCFFYYFGGEEGKPTGRQSRFS